jgi:hypothetical protein
VPPRCATACPPSDGDCSNAVCILVTDPRHKLSHSVGSDDVTREIALSRNLFIEYVISDGKLVVLDLTVIDLTDVLIEE